MTVLVDPLREYPDTGLPFRTWCHLVSDASFEELHAFAERLGIPRRFFQERSATPSIRKVTALRSSSIS